MKKRFTLLLLAVVYLNSVFSQPVAETPEAYEALKDYYEEFVQLQLNEYEFSIPANERILMAPTAYSQTSGNWATDWHGTAKNAAWISANGQRKVAAFVLDTGAGYTNARMNAAWWRELSRSFTGEQNLIDRQSHSTHVSSSIGGVDPNKPIGLAEELVKMGLLRIIPYKVLNDQGSAHTRWIVAGIEAVIDAAADLQKQGYFCIINLSLGGRGHSAALDEVIARAEAAGILVLAAAGNNGSSQVGTPANGPNAVAVAAHDRTGQRAEFSDYGKEIETAAAGVRILGLLPNDGEGEYSGTSMATPTVAALAAIIASTHPDLDAAGVKAILLDKVYDITPEGWDKHTGHGSFVLDMLINSPTPPEQPEEPDPPVPPAFESTLTYVVNDETMRYRNPSENRYHSLQVDNMLITVTDTGNTAAVYDHHRTWTKDFFQRMRLIVPDHPEWSHCQTTYWTGKLYQQMSHEQGIDARVTLLKGTDAQGRNCILQDFEQAEVKTFTGNRGYFITTASTPLRPGDSRLPISPQRLFA